MKSFDADEAAAYETRIHRVVPGYKVLHEAVSQLAVEQGPRRIFCSGAGTGEEVAGIAAHLPDAKIEAGEPSPEMRAIGEARTHELANVAWVDKATESFDLVTSILVGHFVGDELLLGYFEELGRLTGSEGILVVAVMAAPDSEAEGADWTHHLATQLNHPADYDGRLKRADATYRSLADNVILRDASEYKDAIEKAGFRLEQLFFRRPMIHGWVYRKS